MVSEYLYSTVHSPLVTCLKVTACSFLYNGKLSFNKDLHVKTSHFYIEQHNSLALRHIVSIDFHLECSWSTPHIITPPQFKNTERIQA